MGWEANSQTIKYNKGTRPIKGRNLAIAEWPTESGPADYVLFVGLIPIAVVEAKRKNIDVSGSLQQAKRYSRTFTPSQETILPEENWGEGAAAYRSQRRRKSHRPRFCGSAERGEDDGAAGVFAADGAGGEVARWGMKTSWAFVLVLFCACETPVQTAIPEQEFDTVVTEQRIDSSAHVRSWDTLQIGSRDLWRFIPLSAALRDTSFPSKDSD